VEGKHVITIEALGTTENPHPLQERLARLHGSQCGFCTPGIIMSLYAVLRNAYDPETRIYRLSREMVELEGALDGNLCRCTGYKPILEAAKTFVTEDLEGVVLEDTEAAVEKLGGNWSSNTASGKLQSCGRPGGCCRDSSPGAASSCSSSASSSGSEGDRRTTSTAATTPSPPPPETEGKCKFPQFEFKEYAPHSEIIFPFALRKHEPKPLYFGDSRKVWFRPVTLEQLLKIKDAFPSAKLVGGSSEVQVEVRFKNYDYAVCAYVGDVPELKGFSVDEKKGEVVIGGNTTLSVVEKECLEWAKKLGPRGQGLEAVRRQLRYFAGRQVCLLAGFLSGV
jgi:xanthine dehydrogenase/oxidase